MTQVEDAQASERSALERQVDELRSKLPAYPLSYLYLLMGVAAVESADRTILATVFEDVKRAFGVGDSKLGVLVAAYSIVGTIATIPMGFVSDRWNRVRLIVFGLVPWSLAMFWTGAATSFAMMFCARLLLGSVEATQGPSTPSLIGDYYPVSRRSRLMGVYQVGNLIGTLLGFAVAGVLATLFSWRMAFVVWGGMGMLTAAIVLRFLPEPARGVPDALDHLESRLRKMNGVEAAAPAMVPVGAGVEPASVDAELRAAVWDYRAIPARDAIREVMRIRTMWVLFLAASISEFLMSGLATWAVSFFRRYHGLTAAGAGGVTALLALGTAAGMIIGARLGDRMLLNGHPRQRIGISAVASVATMFVIIPAFASDSLALAVPFFLMTGFLIGVPMAPVGAVTLDIVVPHLRGRAFAVRSVLRVGMTAAAPAVFGVISDAQGLRSAILLLSPTLLVGGLLMLLAMSSYERDMAFAQSEAHRQYELETA
jgi:MFS family permease